jgi:hypothetical protein
MSTVLWANGESGVSTAPPIMNGFTEVEATEIFESMNRKLMKLFISKKLSAELSICSKRRVEFFGGE